MFSSIIITGSAKEKRLAKALQIISQEINPDLPEKNLNLINNPDLTVISVESSIGINEIRQIQKNAALKPFSAKNKTILIEDADLLTIEAQNAFLKILEEPPPYVYFLLLTKDQDLLLPTVVSRCQIINLGGNVSPINEKNEASFILELLNSSLGKRLEMIAETSKTKDAAVNFLQNALIFFRQMILNANSPDRNISLSNKDLIDILQAVQYTLTLLNKNINPKLAMDNLLLSWP